MSRLAKPEARSTESTSPGGLRLYTQHNVFFIISLTPIAALSLLMIQYVTELFGMSPVLDPIVVLMSGTLSPVMGLIFLSRRGPLVIDPDAETLTYRRRVFPFEKLGLVRVGTDSTLIPSIVGIESGSPGDASTVKVAVVASGDFILSADDQLPRRRAEKLANHLNAVLADYYRRKGEPLGPRKAVSL